MHFILFFTSISYNNGNSDMPSFVCSIIKLFLFGNIDNNPHTIAELSTPPDQDTYIFKFSFVILSIIFSI